MGVQGSECGGCCDCVVAVKASRFINSSFCRAVVENGPVAEALEPHISFGAGSANRFRSEHSNIEVDVFSASRGSLHGFALIIAKGQAKRKESGQEKNKNC